jgi:putative heme-binding domain-containing protein
MERSYLLGIDTLSIPLRCRQAIVPIVLLFFLPTAPAAETTVQCGLRVPAGFEVVEFADDKLATDIYCLTVDRNGRVYVSGRGYIRMLPDDKHDGRADRAVDVASEPKDGAMGLLREGPWLYVTGDGGLRRFRIRDGDGRANGPSELLDKLKTGGEHSAHAVHRGPDGWLYVLCGNDNNIDRKYPLPPGSPIHYPVAGCVLRFSPDWTTTEIVADGLRNAYGMDFTTDGELITFDSDNERCVSLPWYEPVRLYHIQEGGHYGWLGPQIAPWWRLPPYSCDVVAPILTLGRGSPTGVVCYRHVQFPPRYRGGFFLLDWTFGRIWFVTLSRTGASYTARAELFLEAVGDNGFAPTAAAVDPTTGDLYVAIGGRGTRGAVYRIRYPSGVRQYSASEVAALQPRPRPEGWPVGMDGALPRLAKSNDALERLRALQTARRFRDRALGEATRIVLANWGHSDRSVRRATSDLIAELKPEEWSDLEARARTPAERVTLCLATYQHNPANVVRQAVALLTDAAIPLEFRLDATRLLQLAAGGVVAPSKRGMVWAGYTARAKSVPPDTAAAITDAVRRVFPTGQADLDRECARLLAVVEADDTGLMERVTARITADSDPVEDFHYLIVLGRLRGERSPGVTARTAAGLLGLDAKLTRRRQNRDTNWPLRLSELYRGLAERDPRLHAAVLDRPDFGRPDHALFALSPGFDRGRAAQVFLARAKRDEEYAWNTATIELIGNLGDARSAAAVRELWGRLGLDEAVLAVLARRPQAVDREKFIAGLGSAQPATVSLCLEALAKLPGRYEGAEILALIRALTRWSSVPEQTAVRDQVVRLLRRETGQDFAGTDRAAAERWFSGAYPALASRPGGVDGVDTRAWAERLVKVDWSAGSADLGQRVFVQASCASCHSGAQALGPDLAGIAGRFSRDDLFTAILQPSRDVSPRYRTTVLTTREGKVYQGLIVYDAADGLLLQTGPGTTVRVAASQVVSRRTSDVSLMPAGLLDKCTDRDLADLYAFLRSRGKEKER